MKQMHKSWKKAIMFGLLLCIAYTLTRVTNLTMLPIFTDEAIYIRWSQIGGNDANWRFISLTDGKQPLFTWVMMATLRIFSDQLVAGRMVSVLSGIGTFLGLAVLSYELFRSRRITLLTLLFYVLSPFALMYDRLAVYDSLSAAIAVWSIYFAVLLARRVRLDVALLFGMMLGAGMLNKTSGFIAVYLLPFSLLLFDFAKKDRKKRLVTWGFYAVISIGLSQILYGVLRLSPFYHMIAQKDFVFVHPFKNWYFIYPFFVGNLKGLFDWLTGYLTWPVFLCALLSLYFLWREDTGEHGKKRIAAFIGIYCFLPLMALGYFGKVLYPRFILFMAMPLLMLSAYAFDRIVRFLGKRYYVIFFVLLFLFPMVRSCYFIVTNPVSAPIPFADRGQLMDDWPAGYGAPEVIALVKEKAQQGPVAVFTEGTFGLFPYAIEIYLVDHPNVFIKGIWPIPSDIPQEMLDSAARKPTYFVMNQTQAVPMGWPMELVASYQKGANTDIKLRIFKVIHAPAFALEL